MLQCIASLLHYDDVVILRCVMNVVVFPAACRFVVRALYQCV